MHSETSSTAHHTNAVRAQQGQPIRARSPASHRGSQKQRNATFPHKHTPNKDLNMTRSQAALTARVPSARRYGKSHCSARLALQTTSRQGFRPEASQNHFNNYTCIQKQAAQRMGFIRSSHNRAVQPMRARQDRPAAVKAADAHKPARIHEA